MLWKQLNLLCTRLLQMTTPSTSGEDGGPADAQVQWCQREGAEGRLGARKLGHTKLFRQETGLNVTKCWSVYIQISTTLSVYIKLESLKTQSVAYMFREEKREKKHSLSSIGKPVNWNNYWNHLLCSGRNHRVCWLCFGGMTLCCQI